MEKEDFLKLIMFSNSWKAAVTQHSGGQLYGDDDASQKEQFEAINKIKPQIKAFIENMLENQYKAGGVDDKAHFENIKKVRDELSSSVQTNSNDVFAEDCLLDHIATAQKLLNVMCKYWWSAGWIKEPPHCPVDRIVCENLPKDVRDKLSVQGRFAWTYCLEDDDKNCTYENSKYGTVIEALKKVAGKTSLAQWELELWNKRVQEK